MATRTRPTSGLSYQPVQPPSFRSVSLRLHAMYGDAVSTWQDRISGERSWFLGVARIIRVLRDQGLSDRIPELMIPIDAAMAATSPLTLTEAINQHNQSDALEDCAQAGYIEHATDETLEVWLKRVAGNLDRDTKLLGCLEAERQRRRAAR